MEPRVPGTKKNYSIHLSSANEGCNKTIKYTLTDSTITVPTMSRHTWRASRMLELWIQLKDCIMVKYRGMWEGEKRREKGREGILSLALQNYIIGNNNNNNNNVHQQTLKGSRGFPKALQVSCIPCVQSWLWAALSWEWSLLVCSWNTSKRKHSEQRFILESSSWGCFQCSACGS